MQFSVIRIIKVDEMSNECAQAILFKPVQKLLHHFSMKSAGLCQFELTKKKGEFFRLEGTYWKMATRILK